MADMIIIILLVVILGGALSLMKKERVKGFSCIGCPDAHACEMRRNGQSCESRDSL